MFLHVRYLMDSQKMAYRLHEFRHLLSNWYRRHAKTITIFSICLMINMVFHMIVCMSKSVEEAAVATDTKRSVSAYAGKVVANSHPKSFKAFLVVIILSGPAYFDRRKIIRETWLSNLPDDVVKLFVMGTKELPNEEKAALEYERQKYDDLVLLPDFKDSYFKLTEKVLHSFSWLDENVDFQYVLKADDDTFARIDLIRQDLKTRTTAEKFYWGFFDGRARVKKSGQWSEMNWVLCDTYLPHARGGGYVLSSDLVQYLAVNQNMFKLFNSEDVSVGAWLGPLDIKRRHDPRFDTEYRSRGCSNQYLVTHKQETKDMMEKHNNLINSHSKKLCTKEYRNRLSYVYDWSALPSSCCIREDSSVP